MPGESTRTQPNATLQPAAADPTFGLAVAAIDSCRSAAPPWLADPRQSEVREVRVFAIAQAESDARRQSPRRQAARLALACIKHHDFLGRRRDELQVAAARFSGDRAAAAADLSRCKSALQAAELVSQDAAKKLEQAESRAAELDAKLRQPCAVAAERVRDAQRELSEAVVTGEDTGMSKAADVLAKARKQLDTATAAAATGADAEMLAAHRARIGVAKAAADQAAWRLKDAQAAVHNAERRAGQVEIDSALGEAADRIVGAAFRSGSFAAELNVPFADPLRVPLVGDGLAALLGTLYAPDYALLDVDLGSLPDGNEPGEPHAPFYDEVLSRSVNRGVQFYPEPPPRPGERAPSVTYSDPDMDRSARRVTRVEG